MAFRSLLCVASIAVAVGACAVVDPVDSRYDTIGRSLAKARNESIFLNLVRASHDYPLSFEVISQVTPSLTNVSTFGLPSFLLGPRLGPLGSSSVAPLPSTSPYRDIIFGPSTAANSTSVSSNFNVATQETAAFYQGFLRPIDLQTLAYFIRQGYPRELLFWLFTDAFEITTPTERFGYKYDPPKNYGCDPRDRYHRCFVDWVHIATLVGLTVEEKSVEKPSSGKDGGGNSGGGASKPTTTVYAQFCTNPILGEQAQAIAKQTRPELLQQFLSGQPPLRLDVAHRELYAPNKACGGNWQPPPFNQPQPDTFPLKFARSGVTFRIVPRSAYGVFQFLGTLMKIHRDGIGSYVDPNIPQDRRAEIMANPILATVPEDPDLLRIVQSTDERCFSHTWFYDGDYCVPESAVTTKRIFSLLAQLIAIQTAASDLSITPVVRIVQ